MKPILLKDLIKEEEHPSGKPFKKMSLDRFGRALGPNGGVIYSRDMSDEDRRLFIQARREQDAKPTTPVEDEPPVEPPVEKESIGW